jgi:tetratricopeptide (TPR) repeat protein
MRSIVFLLLCCFTLLAHGQDVGYLITEGEALEKSMKDAEALEKYREALRIAPGDLRARVKCAEMLCIIGYRDTDAGRRRSAFEQARTLATEAIRSDSTDPDANYVMALTLSRITEYASIKEKLQLAGDIHRYAATALQKNPDHRKANYTLGKWHMEVSSLGIPQKAALKIAVRDLPEASIESAVAHFEKVRSLAPGFILNLLALAEAYKAAGRSDKAIPILERLVKLPPASQDDLIYKEKGRKLLASLY